MKGCGPQIYLAKGCEQFMVRHTVRTPLNLHIVFRFEDKNAQKITELASANRASERRKVSHVEFRAFLLIPSCVRPSVTAVSVSICLLMALFYHNPKISVCSS